MSKLFSSRKSGFSKPVNYGYSNINRNVQDIIDMYSKNYLYLSNISNRNNITIDYPKYHSPSQRNYSNEFLPKVRRNLKCPSVSPKRPKIKGLSSSNSYSELCSKKLFQSTNKRNNKEKFLARTPEKTNNLKLLHLPEESKNSIQTQINNITSINLDFCQNNSIDINSFKNETSRDSNDSFESKEIKINENYNNNIYSNMIKDGKREEEKLSKENSNIGIKKSKFKMTIENNSIFSNSKKFKVRGNITIMPTEKQENYDNGSVLSMAGSLIMNNELSNKYLSNSLPDINPTQSNKIILSKYKENEDCKVQEQEDINTCMNFLRDLNSDNSSFINFLKMFQIHIDIEMLIDSMNNTKTNNNNGMSSYKLPNNGFRKKINESFITTEKIYKLTNLLNTYFSILNSIYFNQNSKVSIAPMDNFFIFDSLNNLFHKLIKVQICLFGAILISLSQLGTYEINTLTKNHFSKIIKDISVPLFNLFEYFVKEELNLNYSSLINNNLKQTFYTNYNKYLEKYNINSSTNIANSYKNTDIIIVITKDTEKAINALKYYSTLNLKYSLIKPFGDSLNQMLYSIDRKLLSQFADIFLNSLLYGELNINKNLAFQFQSNRRPNKSNGNSTSINPPFLPQNDNNKFKYTLVLDMDETLIHFFFTNISGMFLVRPHCFEFLKELNEIYEIVTFTAGTKDYADNILNILDPEGKIFKYRLYRQHMTISGINVYKDLNKLGRPLEKTIIIDNLKENFKLQPNNGLFIKTWTSDINDYQFKDLLKILKDIVLYNISDVRSIIKKINDEIQMTRNLINPYAGVNISKYFNDIDVHFDGN